MSRSGILGQFVAWDGGCLFIGVRGGVVPLHSHYAIQVAFGSAAGIRFRADDRDEWTEYGGAMVPSRQPHSMDATSLPSWVVLFVEPETREGRALAERHLRQGIAPVAEEVLADFGAPIFAAWKAQRGAADDGRIADAAQHLVHALAGDVVAPAIVVDERILRAVAFVKAHVERPLSLEEVAAEACLSPSRFRHLFVEQTGMALRPYILWRRFLRVWELLAAGESLSSAAHAAGFADAAHLSRTSRTMFGFPPSAMQVSPPPRPSTQRE